MRGEAAQKIKRVEPPYGTTRLAFEARQQVVRISREQCRPGVIKVVSFLHSGNENFDGGSCATVACIVLIDIHVVAPANYFHAHDAKEQLMGSVHWQYGFSFPS
jgi:hypothetical protein